MEREDLITLSRATKEEKTGKLKLNYQNRAVSASTDAIFNLTDGGFCTDHGYLTEKGENLYNSLQKKIEELRDGIPLKGRKALPEVLRNEVSIWYTGKYKTHPYFVEEDASLLVFGVPEDSMKSEQGSPEMRQTVPVMLKKVQGMKDLVELKPSVYMVYLLGDAEVIWLSDEKAETVVPVSASCLDFIVDSAPSVSFYGKNGSTTTPVQCKVRKKGFEKDLYAIMMPVDLNEKLWKEPKKEMLMEVW